MARSSIKESLGLKLTYQYRLTRYLSRFSRKAHNYFINFSEMSIEKVVLYSKMLPNTKVLESFIGAKLIYINGNLVTNKEILSYTNDIVQLVVSK